MLTYPLYTPYVENFLHNIIVNQLLIRIISNEDVGSNL